MKREHWIYAVALLAGLVMWGSISIISGRTEAWDSGLYMSVGIPILCLIAGTLGFVEPRLYWRWGIVPLIGQAIWLFTAQGLGNLWPLTLVAFGMYAIPSILAARFGAFVKKRRSSP